MKIIIPAGDPRQHAEQLSDDSFFSAADLRDPYKLFAKYYEQALRSEPSDANAAALATVDAQGRPDVRIVLIKSFASGAFGFYTQQDSPKGRQLQANPHAALCWHWKSLLMQVRVAGAVVQVTDADADDYFGSRPRLSRIGAHVALQSHPLLHGRPGLMAQLRKLEEQFANIEAIPRPAGWVGYTLQPERIEFWRSGAYRMHDRVLFQLQADGSFQYERLGP